MLTIILTLITVLLLMIFIPFHEVLLEDGIQSDGILSTYNHGGMNYTSERLSLFGLWHYKGHYKEMDE